MAENPEIVGVDPFDPVRALGYGLLVQSCYAMFGNGSNPTPPPIPPPGKTYQFGLGRGLRRRAR